jgi:hypothetical protein
MPRGPTVVRASLRQFLTETACSATILHRRFRRISPGVTIPKAWFQFLAVIFSVSPKSLAHGPSQFIVFLTDCIQQSPHLVQFARLVLSNTDIATSFNRITTGVMWPYSKVPSSVLTEALKDCDDRGRGLEHMTPRKNVRDGVVVDKCSAFNAVQVPFDSFFDYFTYQLPNIGSMQADYPLRDGCKAMPTMDEMNVTYMCRVVAPWIFSQPHMTRTFNIHLFRIMVSYLVGNEAAATFVVKVDSTVKVVSTLPSKKSKKCAVLLAYSH